jgi:hypothetical protein
LDNILVAKYKKMISNARFWCNTRINKELNRRLRKQGRTVDALALEADEGRDEQRNATGSRK